MREMPHGQWLAFNADDSVHTHDGPSGYDNLSPSVPHGLQSPTPPFISQSMAAKPPVSQVDQKKKKKKKGLPGWIDALIGWVIALLLIYLFTKK